MSRPVPISIALPVYNGANYVREALDSIQAQTFTDFEIVISDNASTDETMDICQEYAHRDSRIRLNRSEEFLQQADNVNRAVALCSAEWVKLFCHDDLMAPECIASVMRTISNCDSRVGLIGNGEEWLFENGHRYPQESDSTQPQFWAGRKLTRRRLTGEATPPLPSLTTATVRKSAWQRSSRFDPRFVHFDTFLWIRLLVDWDYAYISRILTVNRIHDRQVAVSARKTMRSIDDHRLFWREFIRDCGNTLELDRRERLMAKLRPLGSAGAALAVEMMCGNARGAVAVFTKTPMAWWPILPAFILRSYRHEKRRIAALVDRVPLHEIYP
jgi:glycosyltransferase involved in cell wall biosynthesis